MDNIEKYYKDKLKISDKEREELFQDFLKNEREINKIFSEKTGLNKTDFAFLFFAVALQVTRQYFLTGNLGEVFKADERLKYNNKSIEEKVKKEQKAYKDKHLKTDDNQKGWGTRKSEKGYRTWLEITMTKKVPYDVTKGSNDLNINMLAGNHRVKTLGHDPILGWIFGTLNIITDTVTLTNFQTYSVNMEKGLMFDVTKLPISLFELFQMGYESISEEWQRLPAAIFAQGLHLKSDEFTKLGLPIPVIGTFSEELALKIYKQNYDYLTLIKDIKIVGNQAAFSALINYIVATVHKFFYDPNKDEDEKLYEVKTRKILLYSNIIASTSNIIYTSFTGINNLDLGGLLVALYRIVSDVSYITKIKKEFIEAELNKKYQEQINDLNREINQILEKLHFKSLIE